MLLNLNLLLDLNQFLIMVFNTCITYIALILLMVTNVAIDWEYSRSVSDAEMKEWTDSFLAYSNSKKRDLLFLKID